MPIPLRGFGVEIECYNLPQENIVAWVLNQNGIKTVDDSVVPYYARNQYFRKYWIMSSDGTINGDGAIELKSRILHGPEGIAEVRKVCRILQKLGAKVNNSCGLHVHVSNKGLSAMAMFSLLKRYAAYEEEIDSWVKRTRRKNRNSYAGTIQPAWREIIRVLEDPHEKQRTFRNLESFCGEIECFAGHGEKLDFGQSQRYGTVEYRHHHGSVDPTEVSNWIQFCVTFHEISARLAPKTRRSDKCFRDTGPLMGLPTRIRDHFFWQAERFR